ncbi:MAG: hypothetical protein L0229_29380 [Blastocatellia bacterium]|nr:hypothetical protein [Blastocatellia bacterium]
MSSSADAQFVEHASDKLPWSLWMRQIAAILRLEVKKNFLGRRAILIYLLALAPVLLMAAMAATAGGEISRHSGLAIIIFANIFEGFILRTVVFFGCAWIFMNLFRGEVVDKSLHYYFLAPVRREVLVTGKYLSGLLTSIFLFAGSTVGALFFFYLALGQSANSNYTFNGLGLGHSVSYISITVLACVGYGAVFLVVGLFFRNPMIPAIIIYGWEFINFLLPPVLKKISIIHYLRSLSPVPIPEGPYALIAEPTPAWLSVPGLLILTSLVIVIASLQIRRMEIKYGGE